MADSKLTALTAMTAPVSTDIVYIVDDPGGTPLSQKITVENLFNVGVGLLTKPVVVTQGEITADAPQINGTVTWNSAGIVGPAWKLNVTVTSANAAALLADLQVGATSKWKVDRTGLVTQTGALIVPNGSISSSVIRGTSTGTNSGIYFAGTTAMFYTVSGACAFGFGAGGFVLADARSLSWSVDPENQSANLQLFRDAARIHAWRDGVNANAGRIYNTFTSSTNYERFSVDWITTANVCLVGTEKGSGGGTARDMVFMTDATERMRIAAGGEVTVKSTIETPAGGSTSARLLFGTTAGFGIYYGSGAPSVSAAQGSIYIRSDGSSTSTRLYVNTNGSTTWTNFTSAA